LKQILQLALAFTLFIYIQSVYAQNASNSWAATGENQKVFIKNGGQFHINNSTEPVLYAYDNGSTMIYFTAKGVTYSFLKRWEKVEKENERERGREEMKKGKTLVEKEAEEHRMEFKTDVVSFKWENANPLVQVVPEEEISSYFSYDIKEKDGVHKNINNLKAYKKIVYKNIYPNIDIEYIFHPTDGIEYSLIVHPGADVSKVKMDYSNQIKLKGNADLHIPTLFGNIVEHAPTTFFADNRSKIVSSHFVKNDRCISFELGAYDHSKTIVIDPWVQTPSLSSSNGVWECERDAAGNVYIIGGDMPLKLLKYNSTGAIQWTYTTPWDTANDWLGTMATDLAGNSYVTDGSTAALIKVDSSGGLVYNKPGSSMDEYWTIAFNCDQTKLIIGGTRLIGYPSTITGAGMIFDISIATGNINSMIQVGWTRTHTVMGLPITEPDEVRSITSSRNSRYYFLTLDTIGAIDQSLYPNTSVSFAQNSNYALGYKCENFRPNNGNSGICAIKANKNFVYTQNGKTIHKRSLINGVILDTALIPGGLTTLSFGMHQPGNSGIDIDSCGNVYVGSGNAVIKYDANLNLISSVSLPFSVFDVAVSTNGNVIVAGATGNSSSSNRTGYVQSIASLAACYPIERSCDSVISVGIQNSSNDVSAIQIYPNPSTGIINLLNLNGNPISIYNILGEPILKNESSDKNIKLNLEQCANGIYTMEIITQKEKSNKKIIINK